MPTEHATTAREITCAEADDLVRQLRPLSGRTNYFPGHPEDSDPDFPTVTSKTWGRDDGTEVMRETLDAHGCRHWRTDGL